jgi:hypothetical protein
MGKTTTPKSTTHLHPYLRKTCPSTPTDSNLQNNTRSVLAKVNNQLIFLQMTSRTPFEHLLKVIEQEFYQVTLSPFDYELIEPLLNVIDQEISQNVH